MSQRNILTDAVRARLVTQQVILTDCHSQVAEDLEHVDVGRAKVAALHFHIVLVRLAPLELGTLHRLLGRRRLATHSHVSDVELYSVTLGNLQILFHLLAIQLHIKVDVDSFDLGRLLLLRNQLHDIGS